MKFTQAFRMALSAINSNKMRTFLTMLGIIIGVMAITMLVSLAQGATNSITDEINSMGTNMLNVTVMSQRDPHITMSELDTLVKDSDNIAEISPSLSANVTVKGGGETVDVGVTGAMPNYALTHNRTVEYGRNILDTDIEWRTAVAVIGTDTAEDLFGTTQVLGNMVTIGDRKFEIVGIFETKGSGIIGSEDEIIVIPFSTAQRLTGDTSLRTFLATAVDADTVEAAKAELTAYLMDKTGNADDYNIFDQSLLLDTMDEVMGTMSLMLGGIAGISLLVGGIGIMNIMLVSVTERTREIGIRKAIGAQRYDIMVQFLIEAVVVSLLGGLIGLGIGFLGMRALSGIFDMNLNLTGGVSAIALAFSVLIGIVFGIYPANKASKLQPIQALRYE